MTENVFEAVKQSVSTRDAAAFYGMQKLWEAYRKKFSYASDLEWDVIMKAIRRLYVLCEKGISL